MFCNSYSRRAWIGSVTVLMLVPALVVGLLALPALAFPFSSEQEMVDLPQGSQRGTFILTGTQGQRLNREALLAEAAYFSGYGFDRNFLTWAPIHDDFNPDGRTWTFCKDRPSGHQGLCPSSIQFDSVRNTITAGNIQAMEFGGSFIATSCGNHSAGTAGPAPSISGHKYEDMNGDGNRDSGEPGLNDWTINLHFNGHFVASTTTDGDGYYSFTLNANEMTADGQPIGGGEYTLTEDQQGGWVASQTPGAVQVGVGAGEDEFEGNNFGNYRPARISGRKYDDHGVDGGSEGDEGLQGWTITNDGAPSDVTGVDGAFLFEGLAPGVYTLGEVLQDGWRQTDPPSGSHEIEVASGDFVTGVEFGNVCLGSVAIEVEDVTGGMTDLGLEFLLEEVEVGGVIDNNPELPRTGTDVGGFDDLLPGTYRLTAFLPDGVFSADEDLTLVDDRWAIVKEFPVVNCTTTDVRIEVFTTSVGKVTGGIKMPVLDDFATSGFQFQTKKKGTPAGVLQYQDHARALNLHTNLTEGIYVDDEGANAWVWGRLEVGGESVRYLLRLTDSGEPGRNDGFRLTFSGYDEGEGVALIKGNVQIHPAKP